MLRPLKNTKSTNKDTSTKGKRVFVGLSGGVDSAVSAALLKQAGYDVTGVFIKTWHPDFLPCTWRGERRDAMRVALALEIPFLFFDFEEEYKKGVADQMIEEYRVGRTPNPDVLCNREVKFDAFWKKARAMGADFIATGHYARVVVPEIVAQKTTEVFSTENLPGSRPVGLRDGFIGQDFLAPNKDSTLLPTTYYLLQTGLDSGKDQSYFLWTLTQDDLAHTLFPIGHLEKKEVRGLAKKFNLPVAEKKDSQGICFIGEVSIEEFLSHYIEAKPGNVLNLEGKVIGTHKGALYYTLGERHGFEITEKKPDGGAYYVVAKDMEKNTITVSNSESEINNMSPRKVSLKNINWVREPRDGEKLEARIRYRGEKLKVKSLKLESGEWKVEFNESVRGLSLGQSIVFYQGEECLGGAVMDAII